jgi:RNA polymerase sigma factor (sigma-70 family)
MNCGELVEKIRAGIDVRRSEQDLYLLVRHALLARLEEKIPARLQPRLDAEDVLHEAFLRALKALHRYRPTGEDSFLGWVYCIGKNLILDHNKRRSVAVVRFAGPEEKGPRASGIFQRRSTSSESRIARAEWIETLLAKLEKREAEVIRLRGLEGKSFEEIAALWGKSPGAVQRFYSRAWRRFRDLARARDSARLPRE